jgi:hypothetical protein
MPVAWHEGECMHGRVCTVFGQQWFWLAYPVGGLCGCTVVFGSCTAVAFVAFGLWDTLLGAALCSVQDLFLCQHAAEAACFNITLPRSVTGNYKSWISFQTDAPRGGLAVLCALSTDSLNDLLSNTSRIS